MTSISAQNVTVVPYNVEYSWRMEQAFGPDVEMMIRDAVHALNMLALSDLNIKLIRVSTEGEADIVFGDDKTNHICYKPAVVIHWGTTKKAAFTKSCHARKHYVALVTHNPDFLIRVKKSRGAALASVVASRVAAIMHRYYVHKDRNKLLVKVAGGSRFALERTFDLSNHETHKAWMNAMTLYYEQIVNEISRPKYELTTSLKDLWPESMKYAHGTFHPPERMFFNYEEDEFSDKPSFYSETHYVTPIKNNGGTALVWPIQPPYTSNRCKWIKKYPPSLIYMPNFEWNSIEWNTTDGGRMEAKIEGFSDSITVNKLAYADFQLIPPYYLPPDGHYISLPPKVFLLGFCMRGRQKIPRGITPKVYRSCAH